MGFLHTSIWLHLVKKLGLLFHMSVVWEVPDITGGIRWKDFVPTGAVDSE